MRRYLQRSTIIGTVALTIFVSTAHKANALTHFVSTRHHSTLERCSTLSPRRELVCAQRALRWRTSEIRWVKNRHSRTLAAVTWQARHYWHSRLKFLYWRVRVNGRSIVEARRRLAARPARPSGAVAHMALWLCIHSREGAWNDEGAPYYGGLQMTYGWDGLVGDAAQLSPLEQMQAAETGYRRSGYSIAWLEGQWPNTAPPCIGLA